MPHSAPESLAELLEAWTVIPANQTIEQVRGLDVAYDEVGFWRDQAWMLELLARVELDIAGIELTGARTEQYKKFVPALYTFLFGFSDPWTVATDEDRAALDPATLDALWSLGDAVSQRRIEAWWNENNSAALLAQLEILSSSVFNEMAIDMGSRIQIIALLFAMRVSVQESDRFGSALVRRQSNELAGILLASAQAVEEKTPGNALSQILMNAALTIAKIAATSLTTESVPVSTRIVFEHDGR